ncbi:hypothetical protein [Hamadaea tsunoensis]|uniref:hypothetical protein n=1 Tax=Hamadaea tsunoensis TaxID=53368 RepID=UPI00040BFA7F|nr:hypothetical protein [Hamadaea tsunoensis]
MDLLLRIAGGIVVAVLGAVTAVYEAFYANLRIGSIPLPVTILGAFAACYLLTLFAWTTVGAYWAPALAIAPWAAVMIAAVSQTAEGDWIILPDSWAGAVTVVAGMLGFAAPFLRLVRPRRKLSESTADSRPAPGGMA